MSVQATSSPARIPAGCHPLSPPPATTAVSGRVDCDEPAGLAAIFSAPVRLVEWRRAPDTAIQAYFAAPVVQGRMGTGLSCTLESGTTVPAGWLPAHAGADAVRDDLSALAGMLVDLLDCPRVGVRIEVLCRPMCPRFHVDRVGLRLLCTYRGPGTQWLEDACADRTRLGRGAGGQTDECSGLILSPAGLHEIAPFSVALLKGDAWPDEQGRGVIHRSPAVPSELQPRVLVAMDPLW